MAGNVELITRSQAKALGLKHYFTGKPCPAGHICPKFVASKVCMQCNRDRVATHKRTNPDAYAEWRQKNLESDRDKSRRWQQQNRDRVRVLVAEQTAARKQRTPGWANKEEIRKFYELAARLTRETGIRHHVDHVLPLRGEFVSGFHVHENLRVVTSDENLKKGNRWRP